MGKNKGNSKGFKGKQSFEHSKKEKNNKKIQKQIKNVRGKDNLMNMKSKGKTNKVKGNSLFQIIPEGPGMDKFAALGYENDEQEMELQSQENQYQQIDNEDEQFMQNEEQVNEYDGGFEENEQFQGQGDWDQEDQDEIEGEFEGEQEDAEDVENEEDIEDDEENGQQQRIIQLNEDDDNQVDLSVIKMKIQETLAILGNIARLGQGKSRTFFVQRLKRYIHKYYGYNFELIDHFLHFLNPTEMIQFLQANETQRPLTIRTNTLKTRRKQLAQFLIQRGVNLDPLAEWSNVGIKIYDTKVPIGATPQYLAGYYMLQSASSFLPVLALDPQMNDKVLDLASAPGGKTTYIAQLMKNTGSIFANDLKKERLRALQFNLYRLGITNTVITCRDGRKYPEIFPNTFDKVLLDSPCTGLGIISKDHSIKANRLQIDIYKNSHIQKQLILAAIDCTKIGGTVVYSTCSVSPLENEEVVNYALKKRHVKVADIDDLVPVGEEGLTKFIEKRYLPSLKKTRRIYPHVHNMDGFYVAKLIKMQNGKKVSKEIDSGQKKDQ